MSGTFQSLKIIHLAAAGSCYNFVAVSAEAVRLRVQRDAAVSEHDSV